MPAIITPPTGTDSINRPISATKPGAAQPIIVATDGSDSSDAAFVAARLIEARIGAPVSVLTVLEQPLAYFPAPYPIMPIEIEQAQIEAMANRARGQLRTVIGETSNWAVDVRIGQPAWTINQVARERSADIILTGLSKHGILDRVFGEETSPHIAQIADVPLMTVAAGTVRLPRTVVIALDPFSPALPESAALRALLSEVETVRFVNVQPRATDTLGYAPAAWDQTYEEGLQAAVKRVRESIDVPDAACRDLTVALGNPAREILRVTNEVKADLLVVAQRRRGIFRSHPGGGLAARLLRGANCSVLVIPQAAADQAPRRRASVTSAHTTTLVDRSQWLPRLGEISRRNAGRRVSLEVDDIVLGAQAQASDYPFLGADYDHADDRVTIMLGRMDGSTSHLSHSIIAPRSVDILEGNDGRLRVLRIENDAGQVLMTFLA